MTHKRKYVLESVELPGHYALGDGVLTPKLGEAMKYQPGEAKMYSEMYPEFKAVPLGPAGVVP